MEFGSLSQAHSEPKAKVDLHTHLFLNPTLPTIPVVGSSDFVRHEEPARHLWPQATTIPPPALPQPIPAMSTAYSGSLQTKNRSAYVQLVSSGPL